MRGRILGLDVDTSFFTGNHPSHCSLDAIDTTRTVTKGLAAAEGAPWTTVLARSPLRGDSHNYLHVDDARPWTHVRLNIFPDGGVARLRVHGDVVVDWRRVARGRAAVDLAAIQNGGLVIGASDMHFGAKDNMIMPGRARNMGDGWETRRRRGPGYDWAIVRLGAPGLVTRIEIDTNHFKGNYPDSASVEGCFAPGATAHELAAADWTEVLPQTKLKPHHRHFYRREPRPTGPVSHVRLNIFPDGGVSRLRVYGTLAQA
jgi:allantoicase